MATDSKIQKFDETSGSLLAGVFLEECQYCIPRGQTL